MFHNIQAVLFDLDGTLVDSMWMWKDIDIAYLARHGREYTKDLQDAIDGMSFHETAVYMKERYGLSDSVETMKAEWNEMAMDTYRFRVPLKPGVRQFLQKLKEKGISLGIATSNSRELTEAVLQACRIGEYFAVIRTSEEIKKGKPAPDIYLSVAEELGVKPEHCLVFEDVIPGIIAARNAGMKVCAVQDDYSEGDREKKISLADYYIESMAEILPEMG